MDISSCFPIDSPLYFINPWTGYEYNETGLLFGYWDTYPQSRLMMIIACSLVMIVSGLTTSIFSYLVVHNRDYTIDEVDDTYDMLRYIVLPVIILLWQFLIGLAVLSSIFFGISATTNEFILMHGIIEWFMLSLIIILSSKKEIEWSFTRKYVFFFFLSYTLIQIIFSTNGYPHTQAFIAIISVIPDILNPIISLVYMCKKGHNVAIEVLFILLLIHIVMFLVPIFYCSLPMITTLFMWIMMFADLFFLISYCICVLKDAYYRKHATSII
jgi:hypothetical protein